MARTKWNRKRKQRERQEKEGKPHFDDRDGGGNKNNGGGIASGCKGGEGYSPLALNNKMMEAYYDLQGLYNTRMDNVASTSTGDERKSTSTTFVTNATSEEKQTEKDLFYQTVRSILPASFRIAQNVPIEFRDQFIQDVQTHCGETIDIEVDTQYGIEWPNLAATPPNPTTKALVDANKSTTTDESAEQTEGLKKSEEDSKSKSETKEIITTTDSTSNGNGNKLLKKTISVKPAREISFIPHAYQLSVDRRTIRRNDKLAQFHDWLKIQTSAGFLTRQETVSMIPPVVLDVQPGHLVLDMCAAPGSKTSQLLEMVVCSHPQNGSNTSTDNDAGADSNNEKKHDHGNSEPTGLVVANDNDVKRAYMLVTQLRRLNSPAIFMTSCDAQQFPQLTMPSSPSSSDNNKQQEEGMFDRVLADVPCTGDGTVRKNPGIWKHWTQNAALAIHPIQLAIALKGARLTKVGGYLCYSTCSLNPIENEAVVSELLKQTNGALTLVDKRTDMNGIQARPGWNTWTVCSNIKKESFKGKNSPKMIAKRKEWAAKRSRQAAAADTDDTAKAKDGAATENATAADDDGKTNDNAATTTTNNDTPTQTAADHEQNNKTNNGGTATEDTKAQYHNWDTTQLKQTAKNAGLILHDTFQDVPVESQRRIRESCFPPTEKEALGYHLDRCMRILPQDMDTGGFFVALFYKTKPIGSAGQGTNSNGTSKKGASSEGQATEDNNDDAAIENEEKVESDTMEMDKPGKEEQSNNGSKGDNEGGDETNSHGGGADEKKDHKKKTNKIGGQPAGGVGNSDFVPVSEDLFPALKEFYGLSDDFPVKQIMSRESGSAKVMYFVTNRVTQLIDAGIQDRCTVINSGLKVFERNSKECQIEYRVNQEGIQYIAPYMNNKRKVIADARDFCTCLHQSEKGTAIWLGNFSQDFQTSVTEMDQGSFVVILKGFEHELVTKKMILVMWRCRGASVNCLVSQPDREGIQSKLRALGLLQSIELAPSPNKDESPKKD